MDKKNRMLKTCVSAMKKMAAGKSPIAYVITGSGQKGLSEIFHVEDACPFSKLPGFPSPTVKGHLGELRLCRSGKSVFFLQCGRSHLYERGDFSDVLFSVQAACSAGIRNLFLLNSAGAIRKNLRTGDIVLIEDHINLMFVNPLFGDDSLKGNERFLSMRPCYDPGFVSYAMKKKRKMFLKRGVYAGLMGPVYETEAELSMLEKMGAHVVGMSTVQEAIFARFLGMSVSAASVVSNQRSSRSGHDDVVKQAGRFSKNLAGVLKIYIDYITSKPRLVLL